MLLLGVVLDFHGFTDAPHTPKYTGHETFNLRYGWLKKAYDAVCDGSTSTPFRDEGAIARFGVGKNMVSAIKHWATSCGIIAKGEGDAWHTTRFGDFLFKGSDGVDPYLEQATSLWLIHLRLVTRSEKTLFTYAFNFFPDLSFSRESFATTLLTSMHKDDLKAPSAVTLKKDIANFIGTYCTRSLDKKVKVEDIISAPLTELGLVSQVSSTGYTINKGAHLPVPDAVFAFALNDFWNIRSPGTRTLSYEAICFDPYSPGRTLALSPHDVIGHLKSMGNITGGYMRWVETAGVKTVMRSNETNVDPYSWLMADAEQSLVVAA